MQGLTISTESFLHTDIGNRVDEFLPDMAVSLFLVFNDNRVPFGVSVFYLY